MTTAIRLFPNCAIGLSFAALHRIASTLLHVSLAIAACAGVLGCSARVEPADELLIASPHRDEIREEMERAFLAWYEMRTGRRVRPIWLDLGGTSNIQKYIVDRLSAGSTAGIDVFFGGGSDPYEALKRQGHLVAYTLPAGILEKLPTNLHGVPIYDPDHTWYGAVLSTFGIMFNREVLRRLDMPAPSTWEDLGDSVYSQDGSGWVGAADPRHSGSVHMIYENILQAYGWDKGFAVLTRMAANSRDFVRESTAVPRQVQMGEVACAPVIEFYAFSLIAREGADRVGFVLPEGLTVIGPDAVAIVRGAPNRDVAELFMQFLFSDEGQKIWMLKPGVAGGPQNYELSRLSVLPHLYQLPADELSVTLNPFETAAPLEYDGRLASRRWTVLNDLIGAVLIDSQWELKDAWIAIQQLEGGQSTDELIDELAKPPCDEKQMAELGSLMQQSPRMRTRVIADWTEQARARYRSVADRARELAAGS